MSTVVLFSAQTQKHKCPSLSKWLNKLVQVHHGTKKEQTIETYNLDEPPENKAEFKEKAKRLHLAGFYLYNILEMTRSWEWSTG